MITRTLLPTLFLSHGGGPGFFIKAPPNSFMSDFSQDSKACAAFKNLSKDKPGYGLPEHPRAIVIISAHWEERDAFHVYSVAQPTLFYDYYGFPEHTYKLQYPAPGSPELASRIVDLIGKEKGLRAVIDDDREGFDHGVFIPLIMVYPTADIPVVQISLKSSMDPLEHYRLGKALAPLRQEGVLIIGSGQATHPMQYKPAPSVVEQFMTVLNNVLTDTNLSEESRMMGLANVWKSPMLKQVHNPGSEHLMPLVVAAGASNGVAAKNLFKNEGNMLFMGGTFSMSSYLFQQSEPVDESPTSSEL
jgi:aromatic ring-opening dioxygenase catalytic subunit (LigB family)